MPNPNANALSRSIDFSHGCPSVPGCWLPREWPTIPQLYVKGEFVGGCDIVTDQYQSGDLLELMKKHKLVE